MIAENQIAFYERDLNWVRQLRHELGNMQTEEHDYD